MMAFIEKIKAHATKCNFFNIVMDSSKVAVMPVNADAISFMEFNKIIDVFDESGSSSSNNSR